MASESIVRIVINAVDKYTGVLTGLNQGLELVGKAFTALSTVATGAFNAIVKGLDSLKEGGDFLELRNQFESVAVSFGTSGEKIIGIFDDIGDGTLNATEKVKLASKAIQTGLSGDEIRSAVAFTKKWTESMGEDFGGMSEQVFQAFSSGKYAILKQMGLVIDKTTSATDVIAQMKDKFGQFSDTGTNVADSMTAISTAVDDFVLYSKAAIANSDTLQSALEYVSDAARSFVKSFDFETVGQYFDTFLNALGIVYDAVVLTFSDIGKSIYSTFQNLRTDNGARDFFKGLGTFAIDAAGYFQKFAGLTIDAFTSVTGGFARVAEGVGFFGNKIKIGIIESFATVSNTIGRTFAELGQMINEFIRSSPLLQNAFGADSIGNSMTAMIRGVGDAKQQWEQIISDTKSEKGMFSALDEWGTKTRQFADNLDASKTSAALTLADLKSNLEKGFSGFDISAKKPFISDEIINKTNAQAEKMRDLLRASKDKQDLAEMAAEDKKSLKLANDAEKTADKQIKEQERALREVLKSIETLEKRGATNTYGLFTLDELKFMKQKDSVVKALKVIDDAAAKTNLKIAEDFLKDPSARSKNIADNLNGIEISKDGKLTITQKQQQPQKINVQVSGINGPAWLQGFLDAAIQEMVRMMKGERIPLVLTSLAPEV